MRVEFWFVVRLFSLSSRLSAVSLAHKCAPNFHATKWSRFAFTRGLENELQFYCQCDGGFSKQWEITVAGSLNLSLRFMGEIGIMVSRLQHEGFDLEDMIDEELRAAGFLELCERYIIHALFFLYWGVVMWDSIAKFFLFCDYASYDSCWRVIKRIANLADLLILVCTRCTVRTNCFYSEKGTSSLCW